MRIGRKGIKRRKVLMLIYTFMGITNPPDERLD
jgi:hypothetical protein